MLRSKFNNSVKKGASLPAYKAITFLTLGAIIGITALSRPSDATGLSAADAETAITATMNAALNAPPGSAEERLAVESWARQVDALATSDPERAGGVAIGAILRAQHGSAFERQAALSILQNLDSVAARDLVNAAAALRVVASHAPGDLDQLVNQKDRMLREKERLLRVPKDSKQPVSCPPPQP